MWSEDERAEFASFIAQNPLVGDVVPNAGGIRKVRWASSGKGKRGGARVIYFNQLDDGFIELLMIYEKKKTSNILGKDLLKLKR
ncbi:DNA-binding protein [Pasteurellaceae bacterium TAE3-ERU1]|nr:DNA-binding protein [Pasteurellaceae bacterium TAE3-ERU1]